MLCQPLLCLLFLEGNAARMEICNKKSMYKPKRIHLCEGKISKEYYTLLVLNKNTESHTFLELLPAMSFIPMLYLVLDTTAQRGWYTHVTEIGCTFIISKFKTSSFQTFTVFLGSDYCNNEVQNAHTCTPRPANKKNHKWHSRA